MDEIWPEWTWGGARSGTNERKEIREGLLHMESWVGLLSKMDCSQKRQTNSLREILK